MCRTMSAYRWWEGQAMTSLTYGGWITYRAQWMTGLGLPDFQLQLYFNINLSRRIVFVDGIIEASEWCLIPNMRPVSKYSIFRSFHSCPLIFHSLVFHVTQCLSGRTLPTKCLRLNALERQPDFVSLGHSQVLRSLPFRPMPLYLSQLSKSTNYVAPSSQENPEYYPILQNP